MFVHMHEEIYVGSCRNLTSNLIKPHAKGQVVTAQLNLTKSIIMRSDHCDKKIPNFNTNNENECLFNMFLKSLINMF